MRKLQFCLLALCCCVSIMGQNLTLEWATTTGGFSKEAIYSVNTDSEASVYATGFFKYKVDFDPGEPVLEIKAKGDNDLYVQKLDANGKLSWVTVLGGKDSKMQGRSIVMDEAGNAYVCGSFQGTIDYETTSGTSTITSKGDIDIFVLKLNRKGKLEWIRDFGAKDSDIAYTITLDKTNHLLISGWYRETIDFDPGPGEFNLTAKGWNDGFILKLNTDGNFIWAGSMGSQSGDAAHSLTYDSENNMIVGIYYSKVADLNPGNKNFIVTSKGSNDIAIVKLNSEGEFLWARVLGGPESDRPISTITDKQDNIYITGIQKSKFDFDPGPGQFFLEMDGHYLLKLDKDGKFLWARSLGGQVGGTGYSMVIDPDGNLLVTGKQEQDPSKELEGHYVSGIRTDGFVKKYSSDGELLWQEIFGGPHSDYGQSIALDRNNNIIIGGYFDKNTELKFGDSVTSFTSQGNTDYFLLKLRQTQE